MNITEFYEKAGITYDYDADRFCVDGVQCSSIIGTLFPVYNDVVLRDPAVKSILASATDTLSLFGLYTLDHINLSILNITFVYYHGSCNSASVTISNRSCIIRYQVTIGEKHTDQITAARLAQLRDMYHKELFARLPQPIAEEIMAEFIYG